MFDLDGTLIDIFSLHLKAYNRAFSEVLGTAPEKKKLVSLFGRPESQVIGAFTKDKDDIERVSRLYEDFLHNDIDSKNVRLLPGAVSLLKRLKSEHIPICLITGNSEKAGMALIEAAGISDFFCIKIFGSGMDSRVGMIKEANRKLRVPAERIAVVGDSVFDVSAAKEFGALAIGVTTGYYSERELKDAGADSVFKNLEDHKLPGILLG